jgi:Cu/Zn superoxide dismutase
MSDYKQLDGSQSSCMSSKAIAALVGIVVVGAVVAAVILTTGSSTGTNQVDLMGTFSAYPEYAGELMVSGDVSMTFRNTRVTFEYAFEGLDADCATMGPINGTENSCGLHIHEGTTCENASLVGGHYWNDMNGTVADPWVFDAYYTNMSGSLTVEYGYGFDTTEGRAFVLHDRTGARITCELVYPQTLRNLNVGSGYPGYPGNLSVAGTAEMNFQATQVVIHYNLDMADPDCSQGPLDLDNSCGLHIHEGMSCEEAGGHYWNSMNGTIPDPWVRDAFYTDLTGRLHVEFGYTAAEAEGRTLVVHDRQGARVSCDLITPYTSAVLDTFDAYPEYVGLNVTGMAELQFQMTNVVILYDLMGVDPACVNGPNEEPNSCGIHIHEGMTCANKTLVGGHFWNDMNGTIPDPWLDAVYTDGQGSVSVEYGYSWADTAGRSFVIHDINGTRVTCTSLPS